MHAPTPPPRAAATFTAAAVTGKSYSGDGMVTFPDSARLAPNQIQTAAEMWREGASTAGIAAALFVDEAAVWNSLDSIKAVSVREAA